MLAGGLDRMYRAALATSHQVYVKVEVLDGLQNVLESDLVFINGSVSATLTSRISRQCTLTVSENLYPYRADGLLAPYGNMIRATRGIEMADGSRFAWVVFVGRIQETVLSPNGTCTVRASDFAADVLENRFLAPQNSQTGSLVSAEVRRLISDAFPPARFDAFSIDDQPVRPLTWQLDRGQALDELAVSTSAFWYPLADGTFTMRQYPWTVATLPVVTYSDDGPLGSVSASSARRARQDVYNVLTVTGERLNGDAAVYATATDANPANITYVNGTFGVRSQLVRLQTPGTQAQAQLAANNNLRRLVALFDTWEWTMSVDAALELGDTVNLDVREQTGIIQVVAGFDMPLDLSGAMTVNGRSRIVGILDGGNS